MAEGTRILIRESDGAVFCWAEALSTSSGMKEGFLADGAPLPQRVKVKPEEVTANTHEDAGAIAVNPVDSPPRPKLTLSQLDKMSKTQLLDLAQTMFGLTLSKSKPPEFLRGQIWDRYQTVSGTQTAP